MVLSIMSLTMMAQGMTDTQIAQFIQREARAGVSQSQIVTKLVQRGVTVDQIRRVRNQQQKQVTENGVTASAPKAESGAEKRMRTNNDGTVKQELNTAKAGTTTEINTNASDDVADVESDVQATSNTNEGSVRKSSDGTSSTSVH